jgi:putative toxin-antitoxin system antitoxin component (TIGR02293 family)
MNVNKTGGKEGSKVTYPESGVVAYCLHETPGAAAEAAYSTAKLLEAVEAGLPVEELEVLRAGLDLPMEKLALRLGISKATLHRRKRSGRLEPGESDRVVRFARLTGKAVEVLETRENARRWLTSPQAGLGGAVPLDYAETEIGAREVEDLLGRIEYGVYS